MLSAKDSRGTASSAARLHGHARIQRGQSRRTTRRTFLPHVMVLVCIPATSPPAVSAAAAAAESPMSRALPRPSFSGALWRGGRQCWQRFIKGHALSLALCPCLVLSINVAFVCHPTMRVPISISPGPREGADFLAPFTCYCPSLSTLPSSRPWLMPVFPRNSPPFAPSFSSSLSICFLLSGALFLTSLQSLHSLLSRWCSQMLLPSQSLHLLLIHWC